MRLTSGCMVSDQVGLLGVRGCLQGSVVAKSCKVAPKALTLNHPLSDLALNPLLFGRFGTKSVPFGTKSVPFGTKSVPFGTKSAPF